jgi:integrase
MRAMVLLGANCAFGAADISALLLSAVDWSRGWVNFPRPKTGVPRRCPLWPETVAALRQVVETRPEPKESAEESLAFLTTHGRRWVRLNQTGTPNDEIGKSFAKLLKALDLKRPGLSFYGLRHGFRTVGDESGDQIATNAIMGHVDDSMADLYRERISDARLQAVVDHVRAWLFPQVTESKKPTGRRQEKSANPAADPDAGDGDRPQLRVGGV